jgi:hypothetical protein
VPGPLQSAMTATNRTSAKSHTGSPHLASSGEPQKRTTYGRGGLLNVTPTWFKMLSKRLLARAARLPKSITPMRPPPPAMQFSSVGALRAQVEDADPEMV